MPFEPSQRLTARLHYLFKELGRVRDEVTACGAGIIDRQCPPHCAMNAFREATADRLAGLRF